MMTLNSTILKGTIGSETYAALVVAWPAVVAMKLAVPVKKRHNWNVLDKFEAQIAAMHPLFAVGSRQSGVATNILYSRAFLDIA